MPPFIALDPLAQPNPCEGQGSGGLEPCSSLAVGACICEISMAGLSESASSMGGDLYVCSQAYGRPCDRHEPLSGSLWQDLAARLREGPDSEHVQINGHVMLQEPGGAVPDGLPVLRQSAAGHVHGVADRANPAHPRAGRPAGHQDPGAPRARPAAAPAASTALPATAAAD